MKNNCFVPRLFNFVFRMRRGIVWLLFTGCLGQICLFWLIFLIDHLYIMFYDWRENICIGPRAQIIVFLFFFQSRIFVCCLCGIHSQLDTWGLSTLVATKKTHNLLIYFSISNGRCTKTARTYKNDANPKTTINRVCNKRSFFVL